MKLSWWKILGVVLIAYSFIAGMIIPLKPGIVEMSPDRGKTGESITFKIEETENHYR